MERGPQRGPEGGDQGSYAPQDRDPGADDGLSRPDPLADLLAGYEDQATATSASADEPVGAGTVDLEPTSDDAGQAADTAADPADSLAALAAATSEARPAGAATPQPTQPGDEDAETADQFGGSDWQSVAERRIDALIELVQSAKGRAMSSGQCIVNRADVLERLADVRSLLPTELGAAAGVLREKNRILSTARADAQAQLADAHARAESLVSEAAERADALMRDGLSEQERLVSGAAVSAVAARQAEFIVNDAQRRAERRQQETDEYVDARLAAFEVLLQKTLTQVLRGRERMHDEMAAYRNAADLSDSISVPADWDPPSDQALEGSPGVGPGR